MSIEIKNKIVGYEVVKNETAVAEETTQEKTRAAAPEKEPAPVKAEIIQMHEKLERPEMLLGSTYKIKTPQSEHALYITINDVLLNQGTEHEMRRPYEIFINSKNMDHFQWIVALTRIISAVFRKGGDVTFLVDELRSVFDPRGGYFKKGGKYKPSLVGEIGDAIECHMKMIGMIEDTGMDDCQKQMLDEKRKEYEAINCNDTKAEAKVATAEGIDNKASDNQTTDFPPNSLLCKKCNTKAVISMDGCMTCLSCGDSKCG
ncbi:MAG: NrdJb [Gammaproteobacteria bacterium]|nr:NrdJb [Gammaproteobacteria bacterium]